MSDGDRWIAAQNIERFQAQLKDEPDQKRRQVLQNLIEQEREKLRLANDKKPC